MGFAVTFLTAAMLAGVMTPPTPERPQEQLVRWTAQGHDWPPVADRQRDRLQAYDARDGRPLCTIEGSAGLADVDRIVVEGRWSVVLGNDGPKVVRLPGFRRQPLAPP